MHDQQLDHLLRRQAGVVSRRQVLAAAGDDNDIERLVRRRQWTRRRRGVFVDHTGELSWEQRAWVELLAHPVAALDGASALRAHGLRLRTHDDDAPIEIVVPRATRVVDPPGVRSRRIDRLEDRCQMHHSPPRLRLEEAVLRVASTEPRANGVVALLGDAVQTGRTTPPRLADALARAGRLPGRRLMLEVLDDVARGALSALERRYLRDVERAHALPAGSRQVRVVRDTGVSYCDVRYAAHDVGVELDGALGHSTTADRWDDLDRDVGAVVAGVVTLRVGWRQVLDPCRLAGVVAAVLHARGWRGELSPCPDCPGSTTRAA